MVAFVAVDACVIVDLVLAVVRELRNELAGLVVPQLMRFLRNFVVMLVLLLRLLIMMSIS